MQVDDVSLIDLGGDVSYDLPVGTTGFRLVRLAIGRSENVWRISEPGSDDSALLSHCGALLRPIFSDHVCEFSHTSSSFLILVAYQRRALTALVNTVNGRYWEIVLTVTL